MKEKKPVYNGYEEQYLYGSELINHFEGNYLTSGRHHSVVLGISIPSYLYTLGIEESTRYRIFINDSFCRIMDDLSDELISFFGYTALDKVKLSIPPENIKLDKTCPLCGSSMKFKEGRYGVFLGCSAYPDCKKTINIPIMGNLK